MDLFRAIWFLFLLHFVCPRQSQENSTKNPYEAFKYLRGEIHRRPKHYRQTQCLLKDAYYSIGQRWSPDFGTKDGGVQVCIICECIYAFKKNSKGLKKLRPKVSCSNFAEKCPQPKCATPQIKEGFCCKSCPGDDFELTKIRANLTIKDNPSVKKKRNFYVFLSEDGRIQNGRQSLSKNHALLQMKKNVLHFKVHTVGSEKPTYIRFHDVNETIVEEFEVIGNVTSQAHHNVYGNWSDMPQNYRRTLMTRELRVSVSFDNDHDSQWKIIGPVQHYEIEKKFSLKLHGDYLSAIKYVDKPISHTRYLVAADEEHNPNLIDIKPGCEHNNTKYEEGEQWPNFSDQCQMCTCQRGRVQCENEICMNLNCKEKILLPGQCCPICNVPSFNSNNSCQFDKLKYAPGSKWHPFLPPNGFDLCTTCSCQPNLEIICERKKCPSLTCPLENRELDESGCCTRCTEAAVDQTEHFNRPQYDMAFVDPIENQKLKDEETLRGGGCKQKDQIYPNGAEWNPRIGSFGLNKCIVCKCKDGVRNCTMPNTCQPQPNCKQWVTKSSECCPVCVDHQTISSRKSARKFV